MNRVYKSLSSLRLTVALLGCCFLLVFFGTLDQVHIGIREVQLRYFESIIALWHYPAAWPGGAVLSKLFIPLPGGFLLGGLLVINLIFAAVRYFQFKPKKIGIVLIHSGILLLIVSGFLTSYFQVESQMWIDEGGRSNYSKSTDENEFVIIDKSNPSFDRVVSMPVVLLESGKEVQVGTFPFTVKPEVFFANAGIQMRRNDPSLPPGLANRGAGMKMDLVAVPLAPTYKQNEVNTVSAYVTLVAGDGEIGTWLVSNVFDERFPPQRFSYNDKEYEIAIRFKRYYYPFWLELTQFRFDRYPGTEIPRNFSSEVNILDAEKSTGRKALIYMNNPLRYEGYTFYQASFTPNETATMLQVVRNPSRVLPYIAVFLVGMGLLVHFLLKLVRFLKVI